MCSNKNILHDTYNLYNWKLYLGEHLGDLYHYASPIIIGIIGSAFAYYFWRIQTEKEKAIFGVMETNIIIQIK
jgi:hypothetical protein